MHLYFGNLTGKTPTAGSAPSMSVPYNTATNQPTGASYDANGNPTGNTWNVENRLTVAYPSSQATGYSYDPWGRRVWKQVNNGSASTGEVYFYGAAGQKLETYSFTWAPQVFSPSLEGTNMYFGGKLLQSKGVWVATDRLGSVRANSNLESMSYFPYGEERTSTADNREKFGTYARDAPGQDYAMTRYYNSGVGAFWNPDPGGILAANPANPSSLNRYAYVMGDPVNARDPRGLDLELVSAPDGKDLDPDMEEDPEDPEQTSACPDGTCVIPSSGNGTIASPYQTGLTIFVTSATCTFPSPTCSVLTSVTNNATFTTVTNTQLVTAPLPGQVLSQGGLITINPQPLSGTIFITGTPLPKPKLDPHLCGTEFGRKATYYLLRQSKSGDPLVGDPPSGVIWGPPIYGGKKQISEPILEPGFGISIGGIGPLLGELADQLACKAAVANQ